MTKKQLLHPDLLCVKSQICIGNAKIEKIKTWPRSNIIKDEGHVLGNANFNPRRQICDFTHIQSFFLQLKMTDFFHNQTAKTPSKKPSYGLYGKWQQIYDMKRESFADGGIGRPKLRNMDHFLCYSIKYQNHFVNLILGCFSPFQVSKCVQSRFGSY